MTDLVSKKQVEKLESIRDKLSHDLKRLEEDMETTQRELADQSSNDDRIAEIAALAVGRELDMSLEENVRLLLERVDDAIAAIKGGTYGLCKKCGKEIARERLEALPYAAMCVDCQRRHDRR
jgi:RNA polymerase-binding protein DksA